MPTYEAIVLGVSSGGMNAMKILFSRLPADFSLPVILVQHISAHSDKQWIELFSEKSRIRIKEADEKEKIEGATVYIAPPNYHLLIEQNRTLSLSVDRRVNFARPSIDVLFESAAEVYHEKLIGIVLTGSNNDGTEGIKRIKEYGGMTIIQDPKTAESAFMPQSAMNAIEADHVLPLNGIIDLLIQTAAS